MPSPSSRTSRAGQQASNSARGMTSAAYTGLYLAGPPLVFAVGLAVAVSMGFSHDWFLAGQSFCALFLPLVAGSYVLFLWDEPVTRAVSKASVAVWALIPFVSVLALGLYIRSSSGTGRWLLLNAGLGLMCAVFLIAQLARGASNGFRTDLRRRGVNEVAIHIGVASVAALCILVLTS